MRISQLTVRPQQAAKACKEPCVVPHSCYLSPVVASAGLAEHKVVGSKYLAEGPRTDRVHGPGLQVHQNGPRHILPPCRLVVVDVDALQLQVGVPMVGPRGIYPVLVGNHLPELKGGGRR